VLHDAPIGASRSPPVPEISSPVARLPIHQAYTHTTRAHRQAHHTYFRARARSHTAHTKPKPRQPLTTRRKLVPYGDMVTSGPHPEPKRKPTLRIPRCDLDVSTRRAASHTTVVHLRCVSVSESKSLSVSVFVSVHVHVSVSAWSVSVPASICSRRTPPSARHIMVARNAHARVSGSRRGI
jgi:hypothetical protein